VTIQRSHKKGQYQNKRILCEDIFTFDIETTSFFFDRDKKPFLYKPGMDPEYWAGIYAGAVPYIWQFGVNNTYYYGRDIEDFYKLLNDFPNLIVTQTFSKSRSMAGARLGFGVASAELIGDLNTIKYSTNPYNINRMTEFAGVAALEDNEYYLANARTIQDNRAWTVARLEGLGFSVLPSKANFVFATHENMDGEKLYLELKKRGVLIRHFTKERICRYNRITIGTKEQMQILIDTIKDIQKEWGL
jgi:histidinol-phosphate/aromatic aminotransferase/cobyric acid decarboxylase-like protein